MLRIALFLLTNLAIVLVASITLSLLGFEGYLASIGVDLNLSSLLVFCFVFGMAGSVVSYCSQKPWPKWEPAHRLLKVLEMPMNSGWLPLWQSWRKMQGSACLKLESFKAKPVTRLPPVGIETMRWLQSVRVF